MRKKFSVKWKASKQPRKQRKYRFNAPLHLRQKMVSANLDRLLRKQYKKRSMPVRKGDEVTIMRGKFTKRRGTVTKVDLSKCRIFVDKLKIKKISGQEVEFSINPSNVKITKLNLDDKERIKILNRGKKKKEAISAEKKTVSSTVEKKQGVKKEEPKKEQIKPVKTVEKVKV